MNQPDRQHLAVGDAPPPGGEALNSAQKAAIIITALPAEEAGALLKQLGDGHVRSYVRATQTLRKVPQVVLEKTVLEFLETLDEGSLKLGPDAAKEILSRIMDPGAVSSLIADATGVPRTVWDRLGDAPDDFIAEFVTREHPRTGAIVVGQLSPEKAAAIIALLDVETAEVVVDLLKDLKTVDPQVLDVIGEILEGDLADLQSNPVAPPDEVVGNIFDNLADRARDPLMQRLEEKTPDFAKAVAKRLFLFDDIPVRVETREVPTLTREVDATMLQNALAYAKSRGSPTVEFIMGNMSRRLAEQLEETMGEMAAIDPAEGEEAEAAVIRTLRGLAKSGEMTLIKPQEAE